MLPGVACGGFVFEGALPLLTAHFHVVLFNNPGTDGAPLDRTMSVMSVARQALHVMDELKVPTFHVFGHSMGGFVAQRIALEAPERVLRMVLMSTSYGGMQTERDTHRVMQDFVHHMRVFHELYHQRPERVLEMMVAPEFAAKYPEQITAMAELFAGHKTNPAAVAAHFMCGARFSAFGEVDNITVPALVIHGSADTIVSVHGARALARHLQKARYLELAGGGHVPFIEKPEVMADVCAFLTGDNTIGEALGRAERPTMPEVMADGLWRAGQESLGGIRSLLAMFD
ncbi:MAG: alpha/beta fold hydrolase [Proteobacteria bacterium]|nr:alpha/beta fold hydrolase [Pseudomonadota bacterium]